MRTDRGLRPGPPQLALSRDVEGRPGGRSPLSTTIAGIPVLVFGPLAALLLVVIAVILLG